MRHCWPEGELRAYLDGELPSREMEHISLHLAECGSCKALCGELETRAARITDWMDGLQWGRLPAGRTDFIRPKSWALVAAPLLCAAAVLLILIFWPAPRQPKPVAHNAAPPISKPAPPPPPVEVKPAIIRRPAPKRAVQPKPKPEPQRQYYFALDDEPIETGIVVRVGLDNGRLPADVILGPDGRARAFRLVSDFSGER